MDDIYLMTVFVAVAEELSFAAAARRLDFSSSVVTRAITYLESKHGISLFERKQKKICLTVAGARYLEDAKQIIKLVQDAEESAIGSNRMLNGNLNVTAPVLFGKLYVLPGIADYMRLYPDVKVFAKLIDRNVNLIDEGFDVAIRIGQLPDSSMRGLKVGEVKRALYASPSYLKKYGYPSVPTELIDHKIISTDVSLQSVIWKFDVNKLSYSVKLSPILSITDSDAAIKAALLGIGIVNLPSYQVDAHVKSGELLPLLNEFVSESLPIHILHRESKLSSSRVRAFIDSLSQRLRAEDVF